MTLSDEERAKYQDATTPLISWFHGPTPSAAILQKQTLRIELSPEIIEPWATCGICEKGIRPEHDFLESKDKGLIEYFHRECVDRSLRDAAHVYEIVRAARRARRK